jgi:hypothetical protein
MGLAQLRRHFCGLGAPREFRGDPYSVSITVEFGYGAELFERE